MFCKRCGKEIQDEWLFCPNCGEKIRESGEVTTENKIETVQSEELFTDSKKDGFSVRIALKIFAIIALVCFFCPLYMVSCSGQELLTVTGTDLTLGFQYMDEEIEGNLMYGFLALFLFSGLIAAFTNQRKLILLENYKKIKSKFYDSAVSAGTSIILIRYFTAALQRHATGTALEINPCTALHIMTLMCTATLFVGGYQAYLLEIKEKNMSMKGIAVAKCCGEILIASILSFIIVIIISGFIGDSNVDSITDEYLFSQSEVIEETTSKLSEMDMEVFIGDTRENMEALEFKDGARESTYLEYDSDDIVKAVRIEGVEKAAPSFHGVELGMDITEAENMLADEYSKSKDLMCFFNQETGILVKLESENKCVTQIEAIQLTEEEILSYSGTEYIFPDSDKRYLSEDEVRSVTAEELFIGRNEIFARHGYIFQDGGLRQHFESTSWYQGKIPGNQFNSDGEFNDFEKKNVELIKRVEDEINGTAQANAEQQVIDNAYNFLVGHSFHLQDSQPLMEFQSSETIGYYWGGERSADYFNYSITARYEVYRDDQKEWLTFITIDGEEYYLRYFTDGSLNLSSMSGYGLLDGWYEMYQ